MLRLAFDLLRCLFRRAGSPAASVSGTAGILAALLLLAAPALSPHAAVDAQTITDVRPKEASPGDAVNIYGTNFDTDVAVLFGGTDGSVLDASLLGGTVIRTEVPSGPRGPVPLKADFLSLFSEDTAPDPFTVVTGGPATFPVRDLFFADGDNTNAPYTVATGDIDGDGDLDIVAGFLKSQSVRWYANDGTGFFSETDAESTIDSGLNFPRDVIVADVVDDQDANAPGDGDPDIIAAAGDNLPEDNSNDKITVYANQGNGSFGSSDIVGSTFVDDVRDLAAGDVDGDGDVDLLSVSQDYGAVVLHENENNSSSFVHSTIDGTLQDPRRIEVADVNGDDVLDLLVTEHTSTGTVYVFPGNGDGTFGSKSGLNAHTNALDLELADVDGDGSMGFVITAPGDGEGVAYVNSGGSLNAVPLAVSVGNAAAIDGADVDGDGADEVLVGNNGDSNFEWHDYQSGTFGAPTTINPIANAGDITAADLDGDGDLDPILATFNDGTNGNDALSLSLNGGDAPTVSGFPSDQTIQEDPSPTPTFSFSGSDEEDGSAPNVTGAFSTNENLVLSSDVTVSGPDNDGNYSLAVSPRPDSNSAAPSSPTDIVVELEDNDGNVIAPSFTLTVDPVNDAPDLPTNAGLTVDEDAIAQISTSELNAEDVDVGDGPNAITYTVTSGPANGQILVNNEPLIGSFTQAQLENGDLAYEHGGSETTSDSFTFDLSDDEGATLGSQTFNITVNPVNDPPTLPTNTGLSVEEGNTATLTTSDLEAADVDDTVENLTFSVSSGPTDGTILVSGSPASSFTQSDVNNGLVTYQHDGTPNTSDSFTFSVTDDDGAGPTGLSFSISVTLTNDPPTLSGLPSSTQTIDEDQSFGPEPFAANDEELGSGDLLVTATSSNQNLLPDSNVDVTRTSTGFELFATPKADSNGTATITVTADDGALTTSQSFDLTVNPVNDAPTIDALSEVTIDEDNTTSVNFTATDLETPTAQLAFSASSTNTDLIQGSDVMVTGPDTDGVFTATLSPRADSNGTADVTLTVEDTGGATASSTFPLTVNPINDTPVLATNAGLTLDEGTAATISTAELETNDIEDAPGNVTYQVTSSPSFGQLLLNGSPVGTGTFTQADVNNGALSYAHGGSETSSDSFTFDVTDSNGAGLTSQIFSITVNPVNDPPAITAIADQTIDEDASLSLTGIQVTDPETPAGDLTVSASSDNPDLAPGTAISLSGPTSDGVVELTVTPPADSNSASPTGTATITLTAGDGIDTTTESFVLTVNPINDAPTAADDSYATDEDQQLAVAAPGLLSNDSDVDFGDNLTVTTTPVSGPSNGSVSLNSDGSFTYTPNTDFSGSDSFTYEITDAAGAVAQAVVSITVNAVSDPPAVAAIADQSIDEDGSLTLTGIQVSDPDTPISDLTVSATSDNANLVPDADVSATGPDTDGLVDLTVTPLPDSNSAAPTGPATITLSVSDGTGTGSSSFVLTVNAVNDRPTISAVPDQTIDEDNSTGALAFTVGDVETAPGNLSVSAASDAQTVIPDSNLTLSGTGSDRTVEAVPLPDSSGTATVTLTVTDGSLAASTSFAVTVSPVPDPPEVQIEPATGVTATSATLNGSVKPLDAATDAEFVVEPTDGSASPQIVSAATGLTGTQPIGVQATAGSLAAGTEYRAFLRATSNVGTTESAGITFTTVDPLAVSPDPLSFFTVGVGSRRVRSVTLENTQSSELTVSRLAITGDGASAYQIVGNSSTPFTIPTGGTVTVDLRYAPGSASGEQVATLAVESDLETETVRLEGTAVPRRGLAYGRIPAKQPVQNDLIVDNPLPFSVTVTGASISGPDAGAFSLVESVEGVSIASGESLALPVALRAEASGTYTATLTVTTSADVRVIDLTARALALSVQAGGSQPPQVGSSVPVRVEVPDALSPSSATLFYRPTGAASYQEQSFSAASGQSATVSIPGSALSAAGAQYFVQLTEQTESGDLRVTFPAQSPRSRPAGVRARIPSSDARGGVRSRTYRMYSVPVEPDTSVAALLTAPYNFGPYDPSEWRAFRYPPSLDARRTGNVSVDEVSLQEFPDIDGLSRTGTAFWHVSQTGQRLQVRDATSPDPTEPATVRLEPGWNQIGVPFPFPVAWQTVLDSTRARADSTTRAALDEVSAPVAWDGQQYRYDRQTLSPWNGYFVFNPNQGQPLDLVVPPVRARASGSTASAGVKSVAARRLGADSTASSSTSKSGRTQPYRVQLRASVYVDALERTLTDADNWIGMMPGARPGAGPEDVPEPPPVGDYLRVSVLRDDAPYLHQSGNFKPLSSSGQAWDVEVTARVRERFFTDKTVSIRLHEADARPDDFRLYVLDKDDRRLLPTDDGTVEVSLTDEHPTRHLRVITGTESYAKSTSEGVPLESFAYELKGNYPNPFDGETRIAYTLKKQSRVRIVIYDILGRRIRTLVDGEKQVTGPHAMRWDGTNDLGRKVASGVYVYRLTAGDYTATGKMTIVR